MMLCGHIHEIWIKQIVYKWRNLSNCKWKWLTIRISYDYKVVFSLVKPLWKVLFPLSSKSFVMMIMLLWRETIKKLYRAFLRFHIGFSWYLSCENPILFYFYSKSSTRIRPSMRKSDTTYFNVLSVSSPCFQVDV